MNTLNAYKTHPTRRLKGGTSEGVIMLKGHIQISQSRALEKMMEGFECPHCHCSRFSPGVC